MGAKKGAVPWNKGKHYRDILSPEIVEKMSQIARENCQKARISLQDPEKDALRRKKLSIVAKNRGLGGYQPRSGRGMKGYYQGYWCDSSYELAFVIYHIEHSIPFERNTKKFPYVFEGKQYNWIPDFLLEDTYVEIKGYLSPRDLAKINSFTGKLKTLYGENFEAILQYVIEKYSKHFITLYEDPSFRFKACNVCNKPLSKGTVGDLCREHYKKVPKSPHENPKETRWKKKARCKKCLRCGLPILNSSDHCVPCSVKQSRKFDPTEEELISKLKELKNLSLVGLHYNVSGNAVKKRCIKLGVNYQLFDGRKK